MLRVHSDVFFQLSAVRANVGVSLLASQDGQTCPISVWCTMRHVATFDGIGGSIGDWSYRGKTPLRWLAPFIIPQKSSGIATPRNVFCSVPSRTRSRKRRKGKKQKALYICCNAGTQWKPVLPRRQLQRAFDDGLASSPAPCQALLLARRQRFLLGDGWEQNQKAVREQRRNQ